MGGLTPEFAMVTSPGQEDGFSPSGREGEMKSATIYCLAFVLTVLPSGAMAQTDAAPPQIDPRAMSMSEVRAHNAKLDRKDRQYIVCRSSNHPGSLARQNRICRTNGDWAQAARAQPDWTNGIHQNPLNMPVTLPPGTRK